MAFSLATGIVPLELHAQNSFQDSLLFHFNHYRHQSVQEKLYLHTDKNFYLTGEICWIKVYNVDAFFHHPLNISKVAFIELLDGSNKPVLQTKLSLEESEGHGSLTLPKTIPSGNYMLRAYTNWMKNAGADYFFEKMITIINTGMNEVSEAAIKDPAYDIQFLPEGGNMVNGIQSKIAFRVVDENGTGVKTSGTIVNENNEALVQFTSGLFGIGSFLFKPEEGHSYKGVISLPGGVKMFVPLPAAYNKGYVMQLEENTGNQLKVSVHASANNAGSPQVYLFAHTRNSIKYRMPSILQNGTTEFIIDRSVLGDGISHFTLFTADGKPACERLYFKYPEKELQIDLSADTISYGKREKVHLYISTSDQNGKAAKASMSMAVYRIDSLQGIDEMDINSYLWLNSDLKGRIESPQYYFSSKSREVLEAMDNLMLTHGWRRFNWEEILAHKKATYHFLPEYAGHIVNGKVIKTGTGLTGKNINAYFSVADTKTRFHTAVSDDSGHFSMSIPALYNKDEIIVQTNDQLDSTYSIEIANPFSDTFSSGTFPPLKTERFPEEDLLNHHIGVQVQSAFMNSKFINFNTNTDTSSIFLKPDFTYLLDNYVRFTTMEEVMREYVREVTMNRVKGLYHLSMYNLPKNDFFSVDPLVLLDGVPIFNINKLLQYSPLNIRKMELICRPYHFESGFYHGIINMVTYDGNLKDYVLDPHTTVLEYEGLQVQREFFSPVYDVKEKMESRYPDYRNVLYWSPNIVTRENGKTDVSFYSSDIPGKYAVVIQGITSNGQTGSKVEAFNVR